VPWKSENAGTYADGGDGDKLSNSYYISNWWLFSQWKVAQNDQIWALNSNFCPNMVQMGNLCRAKNRQEGIVWHRIINCLQSQNMHKTLKY